MVRTLMRKHTVMLLFLDCREILYEEKTQRFAKECLVNLAYKNNIFHNVATSPDHIPALQNFFCAFLLSNVREKEAGSINSVKH